MSGSDALARIKSYQYPAEHVGHLGSGHADALERFKQLCQSKGYYTPASHTSDHPEPSHDDETLLRYLRARKWSPEEAYTQFAETENWRKENKLDELYKTIDVQDYEQSRRLYPQWTGRRDKRGIPIYVFEVAGLNTKAISANETSSSKPAPVVSKIPPKLVRLFALYENLVTFVFPLCSHIERPYPDTPISQSVNIVDISKVGLKQFWNLKQHMQDASQLATAHYPETLANIYIIGAPSFFPTVWGWVKRWFDPITVSKIYILSDDMMRTTLEEAIDVEHIPKKYGGQLDWKFGDLPNIDPAIHKTINWKSSAKSIPTGPIQWRKNGNDLVAHAVGTQSGKQRDEQIMSVPTKAHETQASLGVGEENLDIYRTRSGVHTHPPSPPSGTVDYETPPSGLDLTSPTSPDQGGARFNTFPNATVRQGTTETRYAQQDFTHGSGQLASSTPDIKVTPDGDRVGVMDPNTVSQAHKEHPLPISDEASTDVAAPSYLEQAKGLAGSAYTEATHVAGSAYVEATHVAEAAMAAMGLKSTEEATDATKKAEEQVSGVQQSAEDVSKKVVKDDPRIDAVSDRNMEEFLRSRVATSTTKARNT